MDEIVKPVELEETQQTLAYRCPCGADVFLPAGGSGTCERCGRKVALSQLDASQTVSFCAEVDHETSFLLWDGPDRSGELLGHFRLMSKLGYGGMGAVYRALDESLQRFVAVKVIRSADEGTGATKKLVAKLMDEAILQARLNHPNVVTIYYVGRSGEEPFFAMELLPGPTLGQLIADEPLPYEDVIHYARQVCAALMQASRQGLVHGDIKPGNLILAGERVVKLGDFGLAKTEHSRPAKGVSGTLSYMAPELSEGGAPSPQSDMYSLGVTLFELTFGRRPYPIFGTTLREQLDSQKAAEIEFPEKWPTSVPTSWRQLLQRLLARNPEDRFPDFESLDEELLRNAPVGFTSAGLLNRGLALIVDYALLAFLMLPFIVPIQIVEQTGFGTEMTRFWFRLLAFLPAIVPAVATWAEWRGWRSLGRYLFQLRLVDQHGLRLDPTKRVVRSLIRNAWMWGFAITMTALSMGFDLFVTLLSPIDEIILLVNTIPVLGPSRLALHDRLVGSHVVLDTGSEK